MAKAKELIVAAHESGADIIKGQAFKAEDIKHGSMPKLFYAKCAFIEEQYIELIDFARSIGNDIFFSIFSKGFERLRTKQHWHKISGKQTSDGLADKSKDTHNTFISIPEKCSMKALPKFKQAELMYVSEYMTDNPKLKTINTIREWFGRPVGYSDHTSGIMWAKRAVLYYEVDLIEKHFCLKKSESFGGQVFRDTVHGATPKEFEKLSVILNEIN